MSTLLFILGIFGLVTCTTILLAFAVNFMRSYLYGEYDAVVLFLYTVLFIFVETLTVYVFVSALLEKGLTL